MLAFLKLTQVVVRRPARCFVELGRIQYSLALSASAYSGQACSSLRSQPDYLLLIEVVKRRKKSARSQVRDEIAWIFGRSIGLSPDTVHRKLGLLRSKDPAHMAALVLPELPSIAKLRPICLVGRFGQHCGQRFHSSECLAHTNGVIGNLFTAIPVASSMSPARSPHNLKTAGPE